jgi:hypothetical protein
VLVLSRGGQQWILQAQEVLLTSAPGRSWASNMGISQYITIYLYWEYMEYNHSLAYIEHIMTIWELWQGIYGIYNDNIWQYLENYMRFGPQIWDVPSSTVGPSQECLPKITCEDFVCRPWLSKL